ncbi:MAG: peptidoglycan DD-metalloendopeptidase family protein [Chloroflexi bacterium]|nr:peptidoglycan DD-metalloendopeptidase family protein [Chloroflexota bacterium]
MPTTTPDFYLTNPVARSFVVVDRFDAPRDYWFAPDKLQKHEGLDLAAIDAEGRPVAVLAAQRGIVDRVAFDERGYGHYVRIVHQWHDGRWVTWYAHLSEPPTVREGQFVLAGQKLGVAGTTGYSSGIHLHLTLQHIGHGRNGYVVADVVDPEPYFLFDDEPPYDDSVFVADVTVPDGTVMQPGETFRKVWRVRNTGTTTWDQRYVLAFYGGDQMDGPDQVALPVPAVQPGQVTDLAVELVAPRLAGSHRSLWRLRNPEGNSFRGYVYAEIEVEATDLIDQASYVADVTVEDGTSVQPGESFVKTWRMRNTGTSTWDQRYTLRFARGDRMQGPDSVPLTRMVRPGAVVDVSVRLTAPDTPGRHRSYWQLHNTRGVAFPYEHYADIQVPDAPSPIDGVDEMRYVADVTVPDGSILQPGESFVKTWRVRNAGTTTWGTGYVLAFAGNEKMDGPDSVPLPPARPGQVVDISVTLTAPRKPGTHKSSWKARSPRGQFFEFDVFVLIDVPDFDQPPVDLDELSWVADVTVEDGEQLQPNESVVKVWRLRNTGTTVWGAGYTLQHVSGHALNAPSNVPLPAAEPGQTVDVSVTLRAPRVPGLYNSTWQGRNARGQLFDQQIFTLIDVIDPDQVFDMLQYLRGDGRLYDMEHTWQGGGVQRVQTQVEGSSFYHVKNAEWEELWYDHSFIYRGTDTSPGNGEVYTLTEQGQYGSAWIPRYMTRGVPFRRMPVVVYRRKRDGALLRTYTHVTWIKLESVLRKIKFTSGLELADVAILAAYENVGNQPDSKPFERYFYARHYGLVAWGGVLGRAQITRNLPPGTPNNVRETLHWLE